MDQNRNQANGCAENKCKFVAAFSFPNVTLRHTYSGPGFHNSQAKQKQCEHHKRRADDAPIRKRVENVIVGSIRLQLNRFRPKITESAIEVRRTNPPPRILPPYPNRRAPEIKPCIVIDLTRLGIDELFGTLMKEIGRA